jgi:hypothetical protein
MSCDETSFVKDCFELPTSLAPKRALSHTRGLRCPVVEADVTSKGLQIGCVGAMPEEVFASDWLQAFLHTGGRDAGVGAVICLPPLGPHYCFNYQPSLSVPCLLFAWCGALIAMKLIAAQI